jgi:flagellar assembly factor FliW
MPIIHEERFRKYNLGNGKITRNVDITSFKDTLIQCMYVLQQPKPTTAIKQLMEIGAKVVIDSETGKMLQIVLDNIRKNERMGIIDLKSEIKAKVSEMVDKNDTFA